MHSAEAKTACVALAWACWSAWLGAAAARAANESVDWLTGPALQQQLAQPVKLAWTDVPLRKGLNDLARSQRIAILLDRRIDPGALLQAHLQDVPVEIALERLARAQRLGLSWFGPLVYFGPPETVRRLRTLAALREADARRLPAKARLPFTRVQPLRWDDFATPRELIDALAAEAKVQIAGAELVPHDLWAAADLPLLSWIDRMTLIANEFDLTFEFESADRVRLVPVPEEVAIERSYPAGNEAEAKLEKWSQAAPDAHLERNGDQIAVRGTVEDHEAIRGGKSRETKPAAGGTEVYTLTVREQPIGPVLKELGQRLSLELHIDEAALKAAGIALDRRVSFQVEKASLDELFRAALEPAGLTYRRRDKTLDIYPAEK